MKVKEYFLSEDYEPIRKIRSNPSVVKHGDPHLVPKTATTPPKSDRGRVNDLTDSTRGVGCPTKDSAHNPAPHSKLTTEQSVRDAIKMRELLPRHILNDLNHDD